jgi:ATP-binding cassette subfamily C protein CydD
MANSPLDPRLVRYASAARVLLVAGAFLALAQTGCTLLFAWGLASTIGGAVRGDSLDSIFWSILLIVAAIVARSLVLWLIEVVAGRGAASVKSQLRFKVMTALASLGPKWVSTQNSAHLTTVMGRGLEALDKYFANYLPQLILTVIATPIIVGVLLSQDLFAGVAVLVTLPLIPIFMALIGRATRSVQARQWRHLNKLSSAFLDMVEGLSTLTIFGRARRQEKRIAELTEDYRVHTMKVLRISFLSGFVLELIASVSVALVAVSIGIRLVDGTLGLTIGLFVLLLTPEAYLPLRNVGTQFHAAAEGVAASQDVFEILDAAAGQHGARPRTQGALNSAMIAENGLRLDDQEASANGREFMVTLSGARPATTLADVPLFSVHGLSVSYGQHTVLDRLTASFAPGAITVITGPSGVGKSTLIGALLGFTAYRGGIGWGDTYFTGAAAARSDISWASQAPSLLAGTVRDNVTLGETVVDDTILARAMRLAAAESIEAQLLLGVAGAGLSGGQAQRVAIARAYYRALIRKTPVIVLDEPTSALDAQTEQRVIAGARELADEGRTVLIVSHRRAVVAAADQILELQQPAATAAAHPASEILS